MSDGLEVLAIDLGDVKTGVARMNSGAGIPEPLPPLFAQGPSLCKAVAVVAEQQGSGQILVGLPLGLHHGGDSEQTKKARAFASKLSKTTELPVRLVDEALSTVESKKWRERYPDASEDSLAACVILERYMDMDKFEADK